MMTIVLMVVGGCYVAIAIIRDKYPDRYYEFLKPVKKLIKREYVGKHTPRKTRPNPQVKARRGHINIIKRRKSTIIRRKRK